MTHTPSPITQPERDAFLWLQGRMVELLLRHDAPRFGKTFAEQQADTFTDERLRHYRELAVLFYLRDELFSSILPRIKRRLSVAAPREMQTEALPPRGRIDWSRTIADGLRDRPGELPLSVTTRQRRRHFTTPENLLTVVTLLEYRAAVQRLLDDEIVHNRAQSLRHPLHEIIAACTRELAFPQFAGLISDCEAIRSGHAAQTVADLEAAVAANLLPGRTSAYDDLLAWRRKLEQLQLLDRTQADQLPMLGSDPAHDNYLYQMWLFYEMGDLLQQAGRLQTWDVKDMRLTFTWGSDEEERPYALQHDQGIAHHWHHAPGVRPDLYIEHADRQEVHDGDTLIWREPGYVLDAKYYRPRPSRKAPGDPVKRMLADLHLTGERHGALLFAFQGGPEAQQSDEEADETTDEPDVATLPQAHAPLYEVAPNATGAQTTVPDVRVGVWRVQPTIEGGPQAAQAVLRALLDHVHQTLSERVEVRCRGVFLDSLSVADAADLRDRAGQTLTSAPEDLLLCPKPHVGPWRVDLVSRTQHCCQDGRLCHIVGQPDSRKPVRPPRTAEELLHELQQMFEGNAGEELDDATVQVIARRVESVTRRFAEIAGVYRRIEVYANRLKDMGMHRTFDLLDAAQQESLALAVFLVEQLDSIGAQDYSAPAIHISSVLEIENQRRVFACSGLIGEASIKNKQTLGTLFFLFLAFKKPHKYRDAQKARDDWSCIVEHSALHWNGAVLPDEPEQVLQFEEYVKQLDNIKNIRNAAAHTKTVTRDDYAELFRDTCQGGKLRIGALNALLLAWQ
jgi:hypothetical protein